MQQRQAWGTMQKVAVSRRGIFSRGHARLETRFGSEVRYSTSYGHCRESFRVPRSAESFR